MRNARFLSLESKKVSILRRILAYSRCILTNWDLFMLAALGQIRQFRFKGTASAADTERIRKAAKDLDITSKASIAKIDPEAGLFEIQEALRKTISAIDGFAFLSEPVEGNPARDKHPNEHTVLIKIGVNWGLGGYPTITSPESIYAVTRLCLEAAEKRETPVKVIVGDESGIEVKRMSLTTRKNFEDTGVFAAAILAALHHAEALEKKGTPKFKGAGDLVGKMGVRYGFDVERFRAMPPEMAHKVEGMAATAGVRVLPFDKEDDTKPEKVEVCYPNPERVKYLKGKDFWIPKVVAEEVTDIINLPKPPGRHSILGNEGLSGALKNYVGLMDGDQRIPTLHSDTDRLPPPRKDQGAEPHLKALKKLAVDITRIKKDETGIRARKSSHSSVLNYKFKRAGGEMAFHEKIAEIYLAFADKERFCVTDMRKTMSAIGPDFGDNIDIGAVIAASDAVTLDAIAGAFLKKRYEEIGGFWEAVKIGGDTLLEFLAGTTWLKKKISPFDLMAHLAANSYGLGPCDLKHIDFKGLENSGFRVREIDAVASYLQDRRRSRVPRRRKTPAKMEAAV